MKLSKAVALVTSLAMLGSLSLVGCSKTPTNTESTPETSETAENTENTGNIQSLTNFNLDYADGIDESTNFYFSANVINLDNNTFDVYYAGNGEIYTGTLTHDDLQPLVDTLNTLDIESLGADLPVEPSVDDSSYINMSVVYTDKNKVNNGVSRSVYSITNTEREEISEIYTVICQDILTNPSMTKDGGTVDGLDSTGETAEGTPIDEVASNYITKVIDNAKENGFEITAEDTINGLDSDMGTYYTGIPADDESWNDISSVTVHTSLLSVTAYQLVFIGVKDADKLYEIEQTVNDNLDWTRWVCVMPTNGCVTSFETTDADKEINPDVAGYVVLLMGVDDPEFSVNTFTSVYNGLESVLGQEIEILEPVGNIYEVGSDGELAE